MLTSGSPALVVYIVVFWIEVAAIIGFAVFAARTKRMALMAPTVLIIVGIHFAPLALVFQLPIFLIAAVLVTAAGIAAVVLRGREAAPSFWCGLLAGPIFITLGAVSLVPALGAL